MSNRQNPNDPDSLSLKPGGTASGNKPDFSNVKSSVRSTEAEAAKPDFSNVQSSVRSTEATVGETGYTVQEGDTLSHIAKAHYGKASQWRRIFDANRDQLDDPDRIKPGQVLKIPAAPSEN
ncbi:LysM peptidoglycan-binding domain-containing protein [Luteimonas terricola]|uniref:Peptidoglycan-binding protein LysM n=1 Tax=Luteimonas terricola TaxID=645597 RepID=A0ABQ2E5F3_9GAMM|nr:LysM peptidoglycan-binding domain-containing protein [Luteimonas terricola]GGJ95660.1 peptidoglycan-binding protein LysM [Luteimonas terricola]